MASFKAVRAESIWAALGGVLAGYLLWLIAISIGDFFTTPGWWAPIVLGVSVVLTPLALLWGRRAQARGQASRGAFIYALPVLPVLLSAAVLVDSYL
ncbi:hypothetical protein [Mycobacterium sp.]|uniref:hypothetical protein n=1 Tax=Mycobacterium sp. TaxID=1785 RepID=UPI0025F02735|nr:hypothetical protein [Mycobacterium sp.]